MAREAEGGTAGAELGWESPWARVGAILSSSEPAGPGSSGIKALETPQQEDEPFWIPAVTSLVTLILYPLLLLALYTMLSRKIAPASEPGGDAAQKHLRAQKHPGTQKQPGTHKPSPAYEGSSDTSSDTSEDSDNPSCPQGPGSGETINYTSLVFPGKSHEPGSAQDYENVKTGMDYVNVDPKKRKTHFWPFSSPRASKGVEYTEVKL
ncbi:regulator of hemoglobinization and erythroid cell expansion protein [Onychostruthus taczanowskii]|uniref:regulator of hemoglobinization and erythroid cell expansion protein n=1 Tax=Onychostruthus taczanowskii TaxID=356909 RepID=UPI001B80927D|nr:regulator of hemoglobinization and erythroid cell expansion protein [Onychostruthus taczanowskii]